MLTFRLQPPLCADLSWLWKAAPRRAVNHRCDSPGMRCRRRNHGASRACMNGFHGLLRGVFLLYSSRGLVFRNLLVRPLPSWSQLLKRATRKTSRSWTGPRNSMLMNDNKLSVGGMKMQRRVRVDSRRVPCAYAYSWHGTR
jgi:hypothetical protein